MDLRRPNEIDEYGCILEFDGCTYHHVHLSYPAWPSRTFVSTDERVSYVVERYREMCAAAADGMGQVLRLVADGDRAPLVFHCVAGKDRTGVVSALALSLLGVDDDVIAEDYELSEAAEEAAWEYYSRLQPDLQGKRWVHITVSPRRAMLDLLADLRSRYGSVEAYAASVGVTVAQIDAMRDHLLTDAPGTPSRSR